MEFLKKYGPFLLVFIVAFAQYANTFKHDFAWDDAIVLTENSRVQKGLDDIPELFENIKSSKTEHRYGYRPITLLSFATEVELFGLDPHVLHISNALHYAALCVLILFFLLQLFPGRSVEMLLVTILFAVHPLHVEVVSNIKSRDEILAMGFGLVGILQFRKFMDGFQFLPLIVSMFMLVLAFFSKESAITFGGLAIVLPFALSKKIDKRQWMVAGAATIMVAALLLIRALIYSEGFFQDDGAELVSKGVYHWDGFTGNPLFDVNSKLTLLANSFYLTMLYLKQFFWPMTLVHDYGYDQLSVVTWSNSMVWLSVAIVSLLLTIMMIEFRKRSSMAFGILWFFVSLSIYLHVVRVGTDIYAERFMFVPSLGLCLASVGALYRIKLKDHRVVIGLVALISVALFARSWNRNHAWKDNETLLRTDLPELENCVRTNYNYALLLHAKYYSLPEADKPKAQDEMLKYYEHTMELTDRLFVVYVGLAGAYMEFGKYEKARVLFEKTIEKYPDISVPYVQMAKYHMTFKEYDKAIPYLETAKELGERNSDFYYLLAICKFNSGLRDEAIADLIVGETFGTSSSAYYDLMARLYLGMDNKKEAMNSLERGLVVYPRDAGLMQALERLKQE